MDKAFAAIAVESRAQWRAWLRKNHRQAESIWLVYWKKDDPRHLPYHEIVEEALCFGWIDSLPRRLDAARAMLLVSPRRLGSAWSKLNKDRAKRMIAIGKMTAAGLQKIEAAKRDGHWTLLDRVDALIVPPDLKAVLTSRESALTNWRSFPRSVQRGILEWILRAKRPETRARRIRETAVCAARGERANQWRQPPRVGGAKR